MQPDQPKTERRAAVDLHPLVRRAVALSIRQPWAWLIINAGKNIENRTWATNFRGWFYIHAAKGMTREEYYSVKLWLPSIGRSAAAAHLPEPHELERGGIVGMAKLGNCVTGSDSPWFCGPYGFVLDEIKPLPFQPCKGALGFFQASTSNAPDERPPTTTL